MKKVGFIPGNAALMVILIVMSLGCATIIGKGSPEALNIISTPEQATVTVTDEGGLKLFESKTPTTVPVEKKKGYFSGKTYTVKISLPGYADKIIIVDTKPNGWYIAGNLVFGGLIGWIIVDPLTGAMWTLNTDKINVTLEASKTGMTIDGRERAIVLLQDVPASLRAHMVPVTK